jgi:hypothetical protein
MADRFQEEAERRLPRRPWWLIILVPLLMLFAYILVWTEDAGDEERGRPEVSSQVNDEAAEIRQSQ